MRDDDSAPPPDDLPAFFRFAPVPVRPRRDGWSPARQVRFVLALARGSGVGEAARAVGQSRQTAYTLRRRAGAEGFAAAWDAAFDFAVAARGARVNRIPGGLDTLLVPRFRRGRLIGFVQRPDCAGLLATVDRLDRMADRIERRQS